MTNHQIIKFLAGCGIATLLLSGCSNGDGPGLTEIETPAQANAASIGIMSAMSGGISGNPTAPAFSAPSLTPGAELTYAERLASLKSGSFKLAAKALVDVPGPMPLNCDLGGSGTMSVEMPVEGTQIFTLNADHCRYNDGYGGTVEENGSYTQQQVSTVDSLTLSFLYGDGNGIADASRDYSHIYTDSGGNTYSDIRDEKSSFNLFKYDLGPEDWSGKEYFNSFAGQRILSDGMETSTYTERATDHNRVSWNAADEILTNSYSLADYRKFNLKVTEPSPEAAAFVKIRRVMPGSSEISVDMTGTRKEYLGEGYILDSPNGIIEVTLTPPPGSEYNCRNVNGRYAVKTIVPLRSESFRLAPALSEKSSAAPLLAPSISNEYVEGELLINDNTTLVFTPVDNVTITFKNIAEPVYDGPVFELLLQESETCPLVMGIAEQMID